MKTLIPSVLLAALVFGLTACGGKSRNSAYAGSKSEYVAAIDAICAKANSEVRALNLSTVSDIAQNGSRVEQVINDTADKIDNLQPPDEIRAPAESFVKLARKEGDKIGELTQAAKDNDTAKVKLLQGEIASIDAASSEDARFMGATGCARTGS